MEQHELLFVVLKSASPSLEEGRTELTRSQPPPLELFLRVEEGRRWEHRGCERRRRERGNAFLKPEGEETMEVRRRKGGELGAEQMNRVEAVVSGGVSKGKAVPGEEEKEERSREEGAQVETRLILDGILRPLR